MKSTRHRAHWLPLLLAGTLGVSPLVAQAPEEMGRVTWEVDAGNIGWCVQFLLEPKEAAKELTGGYQAVAASLAADVHPAIKRAISDEPKYSEWVPSELCTWFVGSVTAEGKRYERGDKDVPLAVTWWGVAVTQGEAAWDGRYWLRMAGSNSYPLVRAMQVARLPMEKVTIDERPIKGNNEDRLYFTKFNRATIQLTGRFNPDTTGVAPAERKLSGVMPGPLQSMWTTDITLSPEKTGGMSGSLQIFGGRGMAKALNRSPIRLLGSAMTGGSGSLRFVRFSSKRK
jgi:hypothetical protein